MAYGNRLDPVVEPTRFDPVGDDFLRGVAASSAFRQAESAFKSVSTLAKTTRGNGATPRLPGQSMEDVDGIQVSTSAEVKKEGEGEQVIRSERYCGSVPRNVGLAQDVDIRSAQARSDIGAAASRKWEPVPDNSWFPEAQVAPINLVP